MPSNDHNVRLGIIKDFHQFVAVICAIGFGTASAVFGFWNWLLVAGIAAVVGYAMAHVDRESGLMAVIASVIAFVVSVYSIT